MDTKEHSKMREVMIYLNNNIHRLDKSFYVPNFLKTSRDVRETKYPDFKR